MTVKCELEDTVISYLKLAVEGESHKESFRTENYPMEITIIDEPIGEESSVTVNGTELIRAIQNCMNN